MAGNNKPEFVLFVVENCKFCGNFLNKLKSKPELVAKFNIVDIDRVPALPDEVDEVPCVYDGQQVFKGKGAFEWLNNKMSEFLSAANDGCAYAFIDGNEEQVFSHYSLLDQKNGSFGMGEGGPQPQVMNPNVNSGDPTRMAVINDTSDKNRTLESVMSSRNMEANSFAMPPK